MPFIKLVHKWASVFVGIQLLLWLASGFYFNIMDQSKVGGNQYRERLAHSHIDYQDAENKNLIDPKIILSSNKKAQSLKVITVLGQPYYLLTHNTGLYRYFYNEQTLVNAYSGKVTKVNETIASQIALNSYNGPGEVLSIEQLEPPIEDDPKQRNVVWQVNFKDEVNTSVYINASSGRLIKHSDDDKRLADFFFMLHFMDYGSEGSFNTWQIILFAIITLWLALSGLIWTIELGFNGHYKLSFLAKKSSIKINDKSRKVIDNLKLSANQNVLDGLIEHDIALPSSCGGGGTCGQCKIKVNANAAITSADDFHFSLLEIESGLRLGCQHKVNEFNELTLLNSYTAQKQTLTLTKSTFISPFIKEIRFKLQSGNSLKYKAGAYMHFFVPAAKGCAIPQKVPSEFQAHWQHIDSLEYEHLACSRSYSLATYDTYSDELVFTIKMQTAPEHKVLPGIASSYICNLVVGKTIKAIGPFEDFNVKNTVSEKTMIMIGAGAGMAPLRAIILERLKKFNSKQDIYYYFGARTEVDLIYRESLDELTQKYQNFRYIPVLSKPDKHWFGEFGYVQHVLNKYFEKLGDINNLEFYLCGPKFMMSDTIEMLKNNGVDESAIQFDDFTN